MSKADEHTFRVGCAAIARDLREFGYPDVTAHMVHEVVEAYKRGDPVMPHGVVGAIIKSKMDDAKEAR